MHLPVIIHSQSKEFVYPVQNDELIVRNKVLKNSIQKCELLYYDSLVSEVSQCKRFEMNCYAIDNTYEYYECLIKTEGVSCYLNYFFEVYDGEQNFWVNYYGSCTIVPTKDYFKYQYTNETDIFKAPDWVHNAVMYQIFPERFCSEDYIYNHSVELEGWGSKPTRLNFMGGTFKGITKRIKYLEQLGITAIYLNPIFEALSNHKYDTTDYYSVDSNFGTLDDLKELCKTCHDNGIRVILDGVFNHCGYDFGPFQDVVKKGSDSAYKEWFYIHSYPINTEDLNYDCFGHYHRMPKLKLVNTEVRKYILNVVEYWMKTLNIDGWRLDVADELDYTFLQELRNLIKSINPECFILGETWKENVDMLRGDQVDSIMNYLFRDAVLYFFGRSSISSYEFNARINRLVGVYKKNVLSSMYNLLGSHDTERFLTACSGDVRKMKAAIAFQFCFIGIPAIYYGDEVGLEGENDPDCRKCMEWDEGKQNKEIFNFYKEMIMLRERYPVLRDGDFINNYYSINNNVYGFVRSNGKERVYVVINNSENISYVRLPVFEGPFDGNTLTDYFTDSSFVVEKLCEDDFYFRKNVNSYNGQINFNIRPYQVYLLTVN